ncbi:hypothetical protein BC834DRAFT_845589 [Gloeopeniophorella convolvens]|nr:hypothetical protein BC834DRAFT_845589 [Gloeopeniophorella convolvens]
MSTRSTPAADKDNPSKPRLSRDASAGASTGASANTSAAASASMKETRSAPAATPDPEVHDPLRSPSGPQCGRGATSDPRIILVALSGGTRIGPVDAPPMKNSISPEEVDHIMNELNNFVDGASAHWESASKTVEEGVAIARGARQMESALREHVNTILSKLVGAGATPTKKPERWGICQMETILRAQADADRAEPESTSARVGDIPSEASTGNETIQMDRNARLQERMRATVEHEEEREPGESLESYIHRMVHPVKLRDRCQRVAEQFAQSANNSRMMGKHTTAMRVRMITMYAIKDHTSKRVHNAAHQADGSRGYGISAAPAVSAGCQNLQPGLISSNNAQAAVHATPKMTTNHVLRCQTKLDTPPQRAQWFVNTNRQIGDEMEDWGRETRQEGGLRWRNETRAERAEARVTRRDETREERKRESEDEMKMPRLHADTASWGDGGEKSVQEYARMPLAGERGDLKLET